MANEKLEDLSDVIHWIIEHDARIDVFWDNQHKLNDRNSERFGEIFVRLSSIEKKLYLITGLGSLIGGGGGAFIATLFSSPGVGG